MDHTEINQRIGRFLQNQRSLTRLSQADVARELDLSEVEVVQIEEGERPVGFTEFVDWLALMDVDPAVAMREILQG